MIPHDAGAAQYIAESSFDTGPVGFVAATVELLPVPLLPVTPPVGGIRHRLRHGHLYGSYDGVLSVSSPPSPGLDVALRRTASDVAQARLMLARAGYAPAERAVDPYREVIAAGGDATGFHRTTAAVRVCVDAGADDVELSRRWRVAHAVGPVLVAAFANSPLRGGRRTGWRSNRQALRLRIDRPLAGGDPRRAWTAYVLDSLVDPQASALPLDTTRAGPAELRRHLDDLPAPVRARGHLELNMIDAQPGDGWQVAAAVAAVLVDDVRAAEEALAATEYLPADAWTLAARDALSDPRLATAARSCFVAAYAALARQGVAREVRNAVAAFVQQYVNRARCPADDLLDAVGAASRRQSSGSGDLSR